MTDTDPESLPTTDREPNLCPYCDQPEIGEHVCPPSKVEIAFLNRNKQPKRASQWANEARIRWAESKRK